MARATLDFDSAHCLKKKHFNLGLKITLPVVLLLFGITWFPYAFSTAHFQDLTGTDWLQFALLYWNDKFDIVANIVVFLPFGFGVAAILWATSWRRIILCTALAGFCFSFMIETGQLFLPTRHTSLIDLVTNTTGSLLGAVIFSQVRNTLGNLLLKLKANLRVGQTACAVAVVFGLLAVAGHRLQEKIQIANWDLSFPLVLGNEADAKRPWTGEISQIEISDRAVTKSEVEHLFQSQQPSLKGDFTASILFSPNSSVIIHSNNLPEFVPGSGQIDSSSCFNRANWLRSVAPPQALVEAVSKSGQITVFLKFKTNDLHQTGPARILTLSQNGALRNFTIGQEGKDVVFRLRTGVTGANGRPPDFYLHDVLRPGKEHLLIATFDGENQRVFLDNPRQEAAIHYDRGTALFSFWRYLRLNEMWVYKLWYVFLVTLSLAIVVAFWLKTNKKATKTQFLLACTGLPLMLEMTLVFTGSHHGFSLSDTVLTTIFMLATTFFMQYDFSFREKPELLKESSTHNPAENVLAHSS